MAEYEQQIKDTIIARPTDEWFTVKDISQEVIKSEALTPTAFKIARRFADNGTVINNRFLVANDKYSKFYWESLEEKSNG